MAWTGSAGRGGVRCRGRSRPGHGGGTANPESPCTNANRALTGIHAGGARHISGFPFPIAALAQYEDGFVALQVQWWQWSQSSPGPAWQGEDRLLFCDPRGRIVRGVPLRDLHPPGTHWRPSSLAVEPHSGRLAVGDAPTLVLDPSAHRVIGQIPEGTCCFLGPDRLLAAGAHASLWSADGRRLKTGADLAGREGRVDRVIPVSGPAAIAMIGYGHGSGQCGVWRLDAETLSAIPEPLPAGFEVADHLWASSGGNCYTTEWLQVIITGNPIAALAVRPLAGTSPADLAAVRTALRHAAHPPAARPFSTCCRRAWSTGSGPAWRSAAAHQ